MRAAWRWDGPQGEAFGRTLRHMIEDVADGGAEIESGDYLIGYAVEPKASTCR